MDLSQPPARSGSRRFAPALFLATIFTVAASAQQPDGLQLPAAATPGGAQPFLGRGEIPMLTQQGGFEIPPLVERPLGLEEGPRIRVTEFELNGASEHPQYDISLVEIGGILARHRAAQPPDGYTVNQLQAIADDITLYYRQRGLILAQAFVPAQEVQGGVVDLQVIEGRLGNVEVEGNALYSAAVVGVPFSSLLGRPIEEAAIEEALLTLQGFPGLTVFGTFREGSQLGETELLVRVREEDRATFVPMIDNYGSEFTGEGRLGFQFDVNNPFGAADRFSGYVLKTVDPSNGTYGGFSYSAKGGTRGQSTIGFGMARNTFDVTDAAFDVELGLRGIVDQANLFWQQGYAQRRTFRASGTIDLARREAVTKQPGGDPVDKLFSLSYTLDYYTVGRERRGINLGFLRLVGGENDSGNVSRIGGSGDTAMGGYGKAEFSYQRLQRFGRNHALLLRLEGQKSNDLLVSLEQYAIGGPANVRAYPVSEALVDTGGAMSLEWIINAPGFADKPARNRTWGEIFQFSLYVDYAGGEVNDPFPLQAENVNFRGYGMGLQFSVSESFYLRLDFATPDTERLPSNQRDPQKWISFNMTF